MNNFYDDSDDLLDFWTEFKQNNLPNSHYFKNIKRSKKQSYTDDNYYSKPLAKVIDDEPLLLDEAQQKIYNIIVNGNKNVFIQGQAGSGKSYLINAIRKGTDKPLCIVAPTAIAASNVDGVTMHSLFRIGTKDFFNVKSAVKTRNKTNDIVLKAMKLLIIDEISMVRPDIFDLIDQILKDVKGNKLPFGGVQVVCVGDLYQLPPVIKKDVKEHFEKQYGSKKPYFFHSKAYKHGKFEQFELEKIYRQQDDILSENLIRIRKCKELDLALDYFNNQGNLKEKDFENAVVLTPYKDKAEIINSEKLSKLPGETKCFYGLSKGSYEKKDDKPGAAKLEVKIGAQVMFIKNDLTEKRWMNGTTGIVTGYDPNTIFVRLMNGKEVEVSRVVWKDYKYKVNAKTKEIETEEIGEFIQFPLLLGYATTIHRAQGKTLDKVLIDFDRGIFATGQAYVVLSRTRHKEDMYLKNPLSEYDIMVDKQIVDFLNR